MDLNSPDLLIPKWGPPAWAVIECRTMTTEKIELWIDRCGYRYIRHSDGYRYTAIAEHRLVAYAHGIIESPFLDEDSREVDHIDRCRINNNADNLQALDEVRHGYVTRHRDPCCTYEVTQTHD